MDEIDTCIRFELCGNGISRFTPMLWRQFSIFLFLAFCQSKSKLTRQGFDGHAQFCLQLETMKLFDT